MKKTAAPLLLASLALSLAACNSTPTPQASDQPIVTIIHGQVATPAGAGTVSLPNLGSVSTTTSIGGSFNLTLPQASTLAGNTMTADQVMSGMSCTGKLTSSDAAAQGYLIAALTLNDSAGSRSVYAVAGRQSGLLSRNVSGKVWLYADRATNLSGMVDCATLLGVPAIKNLPIKVSVAAKTGWNTLDLNVDGSTDIFGNLSASGTAVNSTNSDGNTTWRTINEVKAQLGL